MWPSALQELKEEKDEVEKNIEKIADGIAGEPYWTPWHLLCWARRTRKILTVHMAETRGMLAPACGLVLRRLV